MLEILMGMTTKGITSTGLKVKETFKCITIVGITTTGLKVKETFKCMTIMGITTTVMLTGTEALLFLTATGIINTAMMNRSIATFYYAVIMQLILKKIDKNI
jgi:hypothetical protein